MAITNITGPKETFEGFESIWNAAHLPILYKITNDLFPNNQFDTPAIINFVGNDNGNVVFTYFEPKFSKGDYITIYDATVSEYNQDRVRVINVIDNNPVWIFTVDMAHLGNSSLKAIKYYNNYHYRVKLLAGLPPSHVLFAQKPMTLIAERKVNVFKNQADVFVDTLVATALTFKNNTLANTNDFNDINAWNQFYIQIKESYDNSVTNYEVDGNCGDVPKQTEFLSTFDTDLDGWENVGLGWPFVWDSGKVCFSTDAFIVASNYFKREYAFLQNKSYFISAEWTILNTLVSNGTAYVYLGTGTNYTETLIYQQNFLDDANFTGIEFIPNKDYDFITIQLALGLNGQNNTACLDNVKLETINNEEQEDCTNYYAATNSALQFQNGYGGNMAQYVVNEQYEAKFLTDFNELIYFNGYPFDVSIIIPDKEAYKTHVTAYDKQGAIISTTEYNIPSEDEGLYRLKDFLASVTNATGKLEIYIKKGEMKVSETLSIKVDHEGCKYPFYVTWLNTLGGWNYFLFTGDKSYGLRTSNEVITEADLYANWSSNYNNGDTTRDVKLKSADSTVVIRSQVFQEDNIEALMGMAYSVDVYEIKGDKMRKLIIPPVSNNNIYKDSQGLYAFETDAYYTDPIAIQKK